MTMDSKTVGRLEWCQGGDGVEYEFWQDPETGQLYRVPIEIVRDFSEAEEVDRVSKF